VLTLEEAALAHNPVADAERPVILDLIRTYF
jgi:hypothetical protein